MPCKQPNCLAWPNLSGICSQQWPQSSSVIFLTLLIAGQSRFSYWQALRSCSLSLASVQAEIDMSPRTAKRGYYRLFAGRSSGLRNINDCFIGWRNYTTDSSTGQAIVFLRAISITNSKVKLLNMEALSARPSSVK